MSKKHMFVTLLYKLCSSRVGEREKVVSCLSSRRSNQKKTECCLIHQLYVLMFLIKIYVSVDCKTSI
jgi:hypothetical protein